MCSCSAFYVVCDCDCTSCRYIWWHSPLLPLAFWLTWKMWIYVVTRVGPAKRLSTVPKNFNVVTLSDTKNVINVKLCMLALLIEFYLFIPLSVNQELTINLPNNSRLQGKSHHHHCFRWPWHYFKVTGVSNSFNWKFCVLIWLCWQFIGLLSTSSRLWKYHLFW